MPAIGIDLGTTHCRVGVWLENKVKIIVDDQGNRQIPCYVAFTNTGCLIGESVKKQIATNPTNTIFDVKRLIGRKLDDKNIQNALNHWPFDLIDDHGELKIQVKFRGKKKKFRPHEVISMILKKVKETSEAFLGEKVENAVISAPASFNYLQRQEIKGAAEAAGLNVLAIINEPSAAVLAYRSRMYHGEKKYVAMFDLGASKCDISIILITNTDYWNKSYEVISTMGNSQLGGEDFSSTLVKHLCIIFENKYRKDIKTDSRALKKLQIAAEEAKRTLSSSTEASIEIDALYDGFDFYTKISRTTFEEICADLFKSTLNYVEQALVNANLEKELIHDVVLVGGSTHIPKIQSLLQAFFGIEKINLSINSYEAVGYGAAIQAASLNNEYKPGHCSFKVIDLTDIVTSSLGIEICGGIMIPIIRRITCLPCKGTRRFKTSFHNQQGISVRVLEGERSMTANNKSIGEFKLKGITLTSSAVPMIDITFDLNVDGTLRVTATDAEYYRDDEDVPTLVNYYPYKSIETNTEKGC